MIGATPDNLDTLDTHQLRELARTLLTTVSEQDKVLVRKNHDLHLKETTIAKLNHEIALLRRFRFGKKASNCMVCKAAYSTKP